MGVEYSEPLTENVLRMMAQGCLYHIKQGVWPFRRAEIIEERLEVLREHISVEGGPLKYVNIAEFVERLHKSPAHVSKFWTTLIRSPYLRYRGRGGHVDYLRSDG